ncbi:uncharacterized protein LOC144332764 [Macaca mulatta]
MHERPWNDFWWPGTPWENRKGATNPILGKICFPHGTPRIQGSGSAQGPWNIRKRGLETPCSWSLKKKEVYPIHGYLSVQTHGWAWLQKVLSKIPCGTEFYQSQSKRPTQRNHQASDGAENGAANGAKNETTLLPGTIRSTPVVGALAAVPIPRPSPAGSSQKKLLPNSP